MKVAKKAKTKLKRGDIVKVLSGKDSGRTGVVLNIQQPKNKKLYKKKKNLRVLVDGINLVKKHVKKTQNKPGEIVEKPALMDISKIAILNPTTNKQDKIQYKLLEDGRKVRAFKSNGEVIEVQTNVTN